MPSAASAVLVSAALLLFAPGKVMAQPDFSDIGTHIVDPYQMGLDEEIQSRINEVIYGDPELINEDGLSYWQMTGDIRGIGWGGIGDFLRQPVHDLMRRFCLQAHFFYQAPFVLRWPDNWNGHLLVHVHAGASLLYDYLPLDVSVNSPEAVSLEFSGLVLARGFAYFKIAATGLDREGQIAAGYLRPEDDLELGQVDGLRSDEVIQFPSDLGLKTGDPLPLAYNMTATTNRDTTRVALRLLEAQTGQPVDRTYAYGLSGGAAGIVSLVGGREEQAGRCPQDGCGDFDHLPRTGGIFVEPYNPASGTIFDGAVLLNRFSMSKHWIPIVPFTRVDPELPAAAPLIIIQGQADPWYLENLLLARNMADHGADLDLLLRIYHVRNLSHVPMDSPDEAEPQQQTDRVLPLIMAAFDNLHALVTEGIPPPASRIGGRLGDGGENPDQLFFELADGSLVDEIPFMDDPRIDSLRVIQAGVMDMVHQVTEQELEGWQAVTAGHQHEPGALRLPSVACRVGGADVDWFSVRLSPFDDCQLIEHYPDYQAWQACASGCLDTLDQAGLVDLDLTAAALDEDYIREVFESLPEEPDCVDEDGGVPDAGSDAGPDAGDLADAGQEPGDTTNCDCSSHSDVSLIGLMLILFALYRRR